MDKIAASLQEQIKLRLQGFHPMQLRVTDESHQHIGHAGAKEGGKHFAIEIISLQFAGLSLIKRHQMIYEVLKDLLGPKQIHALKIKAYMPEEKVLGYPSTA